MEIAEGESQLDLYAAIRAQVHGRLRVRWSAKAQLAMIRRSRPLSNAYRSR
jgi:hypothetical protein